MGSWILKRERGYHSCGPAALAAADHEREGRTMRTHSKTLLGTLAFLLVSSSLEAHHSRAQFDVTRDITMVGIVTRFEWTNPHTYLYIDVADDQNKTTEWSIEFAAIGQLTRAGWTRHSFKPGDKVKVVGNAARDAATKLVLMKNLYGYTASGEEIRLPIQAAKSNPQ